MATKSKTKKPKLEIVDVKHVGETTEISESFLPEGNQEGDQGDAATADDTNQDTSPAPASFVLIGKEGSIWGIGTTQEETIEDANKQGPKRKFSMKNTWKEFKEGEASLIPCSELLFQDVQNGDGSVPYKVINHVAYTEEEASILEAPKSDSTETETAATESTEEAPGEIDAFASPPGRDYQDGTDNRKPKEEQEENRKYLTLRKAPLSLGELPESSGTFLAELERRNKNRIAAERGVDHMKPANLYSKEAEKAYNDARKKLKETAEEDLPMVSTDINRLLWAFRRVCEHAKIDAGAVFDLARREIPIDSDVEEHQALMEEKAREAKKPKEVEGQTKLKFDDGSEAEAASECVTTHITGDLPGDLSGDLPGELVDHTLEIEQAEVEVTEETVKYMLTKKFKSVEGCFATVVKHKNYPNAADVWIGEVTTESVELSVKDADDEPTQGLVQVVFKGVLADAQEADPKSEQTGESTQSEPDETATSSPADTSESDQGKSTEAESTQTDSDSGLTTEQTETGSSADAQE